MQNVIPQKCPSCGQDMHVCRLRCPVCSTEVQGDFLMSRIARLSGEQLAFLETFVRCRGSLKDLGSEIGISYPTARNRLDSLIETLGLSPDGENPRAQRLEILERLKNREIDTEQALKLLGGEFL